MAAADHVLEAGAELAQQPLQRAAGAGKVAAKDVAGVLQARRSGFWNEGGRNGGGWKECRKKKPRLRTRALRAERGAARRGDATRAIPAIAAYLVADVLSGWLNPRISYR